MCCFKLQLYEIAPVLRNFPLPFCKAFQYFEGIKNHILKVVDEHKKSRVTGEPRDLIDSYLEEMEKVRHTKYLFVLYIFVLNLSAQYGWLPAGAGSLPLLQSHVSMVYVLFVAEVFFLFSHCTPQGA